ncbi:MAG: SOS response-associated peptidase, partial [Bacteroidota bacterium]|nr:SOS response-associated peptidase [Bacteroidota bacterium]
KETGELKQYVTPTVSKCTTGANELMAKIHNKGQRMPAILTIEQMKEWLSVDLSDERITQIASTPYPAEDMEAYSVRKDFKKINTPQEKYEYAELSEEFC